MKKFTKVCLIVALTLVIVGCLLTGIGFLIGGPEVIETINGERFFKGITVFDGNFDFNDDNYTTYKQDVDQLAHKNEISSMDIEIGGGELILKESTNDYFMLKVKSTNKVSYKVSNGTLKIEGLKRVTHFNSRNLVELYIPKGMKFEEVSISIGAGKAELIALESQDVLLEIGAGKIEVVGIEATELQIEVGAGELVCSDAMIQEGQLSVGMGSLTYQGSILGDLSANCSMGEISMELEGKEEDHNYNLDCSMGEIRVGGFSSSGIGADRTINNQANSDFDLECSMGTIQIKFEN